MSNDHPEKPASEFVNRAGEKLAFALDHFGCAVAGLSIADLGSQMGGFVDCLLQRGAQQVYSVDTCYGTLAWKLRNDPRVVVLERHNALHVRLAGPVGGVTIDVGWTRQQKILPKALKLLGPEGGWILSLLKPQYEAHDHERKGGVVIDGAEEAILDRVLDGAREAGLPLKGHVRSALRGGKGNPEFFLYLEKPPHDV